MISSAAASGIRSALILRSKDWLEERGSVDPHLRPGERPRRIDVSFWQKDLTGLMEALRPQSPALLAAGAFGGNFQIGSFSLSDRNSFLRG